MTKRIEVRQTRPEDAAGIAALLRESITELCVADHQNDPETLALWLRNKTSEQVLKWIAAEGDYAIVAVAGSVTVGMGSASRAGRVLLCYVRPGFDRRGVGTAILADLERRALEWGVTRLVVDSSLTARPFYEKQGWAKSGEPKPGFGITRCFPYEKILV